MAGRRDDRGDDRAVLRAGGGRKPPLVSVTCGQTLTHSIRLANDLTNCAGDGLIVGADGVTVDLNGHAIDGDGTPGATGPDVGILDTGRNGVTIKGGTVREFDRGVVSTARAAIV